MTVLRPQNSIQKWLKWFENKSDRMRFHLEFAWIVVELWEIIQDAGNFFRRILWKTWDERWVSWARTASLRMERWNECSCLGVKKNQCILELLMCRVKKKKDLHVMPVSALITAYWSTGLAGLEDVEFQLLWNIHVDGVLGNQTSICGWEFWFGSRINGNWRLRSEWNIH